MADPSVVLPSAGISKAPNLVVRAYDTFNAVKVNRGRLSDIDSQCKHLLSTVRDYSQQLVETGASTTEADEIDSAIQGILVRISGWAKLSDNAAFLRQNQIQIGIDQCYRDLKACTDRFTVASSLAQNSQSHEQRKDQHRHHLQLVDMIAKLQDDIRKLHIMPLEASRSREQLPPQVVDVDGQLGQGPVPEVVPPSRSKAADHSGKVSKLSENPVIEGTQLLFYKGEWTSDEERTTLCRLRDQSPDSQKRFKEWIEGGLSFQHRNILHFEGHVTINGVVYSVNPNPNIENGNIREYLRRNPDANRLRLLGEIASGVEFFHEREFLHGDLCDKNVLINRDGKAIVCGFDMSEFSKPAVSRARWLAPEQITSDSVAVPTEKADIWSFGLLCLEVFTGRDPYHGHSDFRVPVLLNEGTHPEHPGSMAVGLSPNMWDLMRSCWKVDPGQRPSMSEIQSTIRDMLPRRDGRHPSDGNIPVPTPAIDTSPLNEVKRSTVETPLPLSPLGLTGITSATPPATPPATHQPNVVANSSRFVDQQTDTQTPYRRRGATDSPSSITPHLSSLPEDPPNPDIPVLLQPAPSQDRNHSSHSTAPDRSTSSTLPSDLQRVNSSSSQSTTSTTGSNKIPPGIRSIWNKRSQTSSDTSPRISSDSPRPGSSSSGHSSFHPGSPPAKPPPNRATTMPPKPPSPDRTRTMPIKKNSKMVATRQATLSIDLPQNRNWEPVSSVVLSLMDMAANDSECLLRLATDGTVSSGNLEGLVFRVITDIEGPSKSDHFIPTFLTIYQLFATSERLFRILKRRFVSSESDPVAARARYPILLFIESWIKKGFADEDLKCTSMIEEFVLPLVGSEKISETMEAEAKEIARLINDPDYVRLRQPINCTALRSEPAERPQGVTPNDLAAALTVVEGDRFKCITYWDYVNFTRWPPHVRRIEVFNIVHDLVKVWVQTTILESDFLEERVEMYEEWILTAKACRALNNFSTTSAIVLALMSPLVRALALTCESKAKQDLYALAKELTPTDGVYEDTLQNVKTNDLIPWLELHLSTLNSSFARSNPIVEKDGHPLIDFKDCSDIAEQIDTLVQYSPPLTRNTTRPDLLAYVEYSLKSRRSEDVLRDAEKRSARLANEERGFDAQRKKMMGLGFAWSPPRRRK